MRTVVIVTYPLLQVRQWAWSFRVATSQLSADVLAVYLLLINVR